MKYNTVCVCSPAFRIWINKRKADCVVLTLIAAAVALCAESARAQCYGFQDGTGKSVILNIQNLPKPEVTSFEGVLSYTYDLANVSGNRVTVTTDGAAHSLNLVRRIHYQSE